VRLFASRIADAVIEGQQLRGEGAGGDAAEAQADGAQPAASGAPEDTGTRPSLSASGDGTSSVTTARDPGRESQNFTDMQNAAPSAETQVSVPGNQGFGKTGQQPAAVGDPEQAGTHAPVRGAFGETAEGDTRPPQDAEQDKGAESVGAAK
jgi:hypothetical protein